MIPGRVRLGATVAVVVALAAGSGCGGLTAGGANDTLAPLVPGSTGPPVTEVRGTHPDGQPVINTQGPTTTTLPREPGDPAELEADEANPVSVAARFLSAAASGDQATAIGLEVSGREPTSFDWARNAFAQYTEVAGVQAWGQPRCDEPADAVVQCSWLQTDAPPTLLLVQEGSTWRVSYPFFNVAGEPQPAGTGCIAGSSNVNFRGGPGTNWPRFSSISAGSCAVTVFDAVHTDPTNGDRWRMVESDGQRGWIIERVLNVQ